MQAPSQRVHVRTFWLLPITTRPLNLLYSLTHAYTSSPQTNLAFLLELLVARKAPSNGSTDSSFFQDRESLIPCLRYKAGDNCIPSFKHSKDFFKLHIKTGQTFIFCHYFDSFPYFPVPTMGLL